MIQTIYVMKRHDIAEVPYCGDEAGKVKAQSMTAWADR